MRVFIPYRGLWKPLRFLLAGIGFGVGIGTFFHDGFENGRCTFDFAFRSLDSYQPKFIVKADTCALRNSIIDRKLNLARFHYAARVHKQLASKRLVRAAAFNGCSVSDFVHAHVELAAKKVIEEHGKLHLDQAQSRILVDALLTPKNPNINCSSNQHMTPHEPLQIQPVPNVGVTGVARQTLRLRVPETLPLEGDWNFHVFPGVFALFVDETITLLERSIARDREHWLAMWLFGAGWYRDYEIHCKFKKLLKQDQTISDNSLQVFQETLWWHASDSIWTKNFAYYDCPQCNNRFHPETGYVYNWTIGEDLAACGGRRFTCPENHTLYSKTEWDS